MIDLSIGDILAKANAILGKVNQNSQEQLAIQYSRPYRRVIYFEFLSDEKPEQLNYSSTKRHVYFGEHDLNNNTIGLDEDWILHGHSQNIPCSAPHFCHQFGFWPKTTDHPLFVKNFMMIWRKVYAK